jgi:hypothetical protein
MGKSTISMVIFNSYFMPEGISVEKTSSSQIPTPAALIIVTRCHAAVPTVWRWDS